METRCAHVSACSQFINTQRLGKSGLQPITRPGDPMALAARRRDLSQAVKPRELSEIITHLAFYSGWGNADSAVSAAKGVFAQRKIGVDQIPAAMPKLLPLDEAAEAQRAQRVGYRNDPDELHQHVL